MKKRVFGLVTLKIDIISSIMLDVLNGTWKIMIILQTIYDSNPGKPHHVVSQFYYAIFTIQSFTDLSILSKAIFQYNDEVYRLR